MELEKTDPSREALRVYQDEKNFWRIAARWEYLWSEARALQDADDVMTDSMALPPEEDRSSREEGHPPMTDSVIPT